MKALSIRQPHAEAIMRSVKPKGFSSRPTKVRGRGRVHIDLLTDHTELFKQFSDNAAFKKWLANANFSATYAPPAA